MFNEEYDYLEVLPKNLHMFGGGSSGGGGGASGSHDWPDYMKSWHQMMLLTVQNLIETAGNTLPETIAFDPKVWFGIPDGNSVYAALNTYKALDVDAMLASIMSNPSFLIPPADLASIKAKAGALRDELIVSVPYGAAVDDLIDAHAVKLLQRVNDDVIPKIEVGMRDVNAVIGSSFVIAKELAMEDYTTDVADFSAKVRVRFWELRHELYKFVEDVWIRSSLQASELAYKYAAMKIEKVKLQVSMAAEIGNAAVLAQSKYGVVSTEREIRNRAWKLDLYDHMFKAMASISGASLSGGSKSDQSSASSMFSGGLGMAAMGAGIGGYLAAGSTVGGLAGGATAGGTLGMAGGPVGALIGAAVGLGIGMLTSKR